MRLVAKWDADEVGHLGDQLRTIYPRTEHSLLVDVRDSTADITSGWRKRARKTARKHGKLYPLAISGELTDGGWGGVIGPESNKPQGGMAFEYGGPSIARSTSPNWVNPPIRTRWGWVGGPGLGQRVGQNEPHMDGNITADVEFPKFIEKVTETAMRSFW